MTKSEKLVRFYSECQTKGYTDMTNPTHSLKAKVIASDLNLPYGKIAELYIAARKAYELDLKKKEQAAQAAAVEAARLSKTGEKTMTLYGSLNNKNEAVYVYRRDDESIYCEYSGSGKIEGLQITVEKGGVINYNYHPSQTVYTGASAGGIHMGGFHETKAHVTQSYSSTGKGDVVALFGNYKMVLKEVEIEEAVQNAFKRDLPFKLLDKKSKKIICYNNEAASDAQLLLKATLSSGADIYRTNSAISQAADMSRLSMQRCKVIADFLNRIILHDYPPTDEEIYIKADELSQRDTLQDLSQSRKMFLHIGDYKDSSTRANAIGKRLKDLEQQSKEQAILKKEQFQRDLKKGLKITIPILAALVAFAILSFFVFIPLAKYNAAVKLYKHGQYNEAIAAFQAMEGYKDSANMIELCKDGITEDQYAAAENLLKSGDYLAAGDAFSNIEKSNYKDTKNLRKEAYLKAANELLKQKPIDLTALERIPDDIYKANPKQCYQFAKALFEDKQWELSQQYFERCPNYKDSYHHIFYTKAMIASAAGDRLTAIRYMKINLGFENTNNLIRKTIYEEIENTEKLTLNDAIDLLKSIPKLDAKGEKRYHLYREIQKCQKKYHGYQKVYRSDGKIEASDGTIEPSFYISKGVLYYDFDNKYLWKINDGKVVKGTGEYSFEVHTSGANGHVDIFFSEHQLKSDIGGYMVIFYYKS